VCFDCLAARALTANRLVFHFQADLPVAKRNAACFLLKGSFSLKISKVLFKKIPNQFVGFIRLKVAFH